MEFDFGKVVKTALTFTLAGVLVSFTLPIVCAAVGFPSEFVAEVAAKHTLAWCTTFFGTLGTMQGIAAPVITNVISFFTGNHNSEKDSPSHDIPPALGMPATMLSKAQHPQIEAALHPENAANPANTIKSPRIIGQIEHEPVPMLHR